MSNPVNNKDAATKLYVDEISITKADVYHPHLYTDIVNFEDGVT